jgi:8-oxo-dGTP pyrophosphatase MutT (NUDIX family)
MVMRRRAARIIVIADRSVLLIKGCDPAHPEHGTWWLTPGGGINEGESIEAAAARELREETGLELEPHQMGPVVATRVAEFDYGDVAHLQTEWFFAVWVKEFTPSVEGWDELEQDALLELRWWTLPELVATDNRLHPTEIIDVVRALVDGSFEAPMELSGL